MDSGSAEQESIGAGAVQSCNASRRRRTNRCRLPQFNDFVFVEVRPLPKYTKNLFSYKGRQCEVLLLEKHNIVTKLIRSNSRCEGGWTPKL